MNTITVEKASLDLINAAVKVAQYNAPVRILSEAGNFVLISDEEWSSLQETLHLMSVPGFLESLNKADQEEWFSEDKVGQVETTF